LSARKRRCGDVERYLFAAHGTGRERREEGREREREREREIKKNVLGASILLLSGGGSSIVVVSIFYRDGQGTHNK